MFYSLSRSQDLIQELDLYIADWTGTEYAVLFSSLQHLIRISRNKDYSEARQYVMEYKDDFHYAAGGSWLYNEVMFLDTNTRWW